MQLYGSHGTKCLDVHGSLSGAEYLSYGVSDVSAISENPTQGKTYYIHDHLGSVRLAINHMGIVNNSIEYAPFGETITDYAASGPAPRLGWIGKELDAETGHGNFGVRNNDFEGGRFLSGDALWEEYRAWTPYHYSRNSSTTLLDRSGLNDSFWDLEWSSETQNLYQNFKESLSKIDVVQVEFSKTYLKGSVGVQLGPVGAKLGGAIADASVGVKGSVATGEVTGSVEVSAANADASVTLGPVKVGPQVKVAHVKIDKIGSGDTKVEHNDVSVKYVTNIGQKQGSEETSMEWTVDNTTTVSGTVSFGVGIGVKIKAGLNIGRAVETLGYGINFGLNLMGDYIEQQMNAMSQQE